MRSLSGTQMRSPLRIQPESYSFRRQTPIRHNPQNCRCQPRIHFRTTDRYVCGRKAQSFVQKLELKRRRYRPLRKPSLCSPIESAPHQARHNGKCRHCAKTASISPHGCANPKATHRHRRQTLYRRTQTEDRSNLHQDHWCK